MTSDLVMVDLDGTLLDRDAAFRRSVERFVHVHRLGEPVAQWIMNLDDDGYTPRAQVADALTAEFPMLRSTDCWALLDEGGSEEIEISRSVVAALNCLRAAGRHIVIVSNGPTAMQERKIHRTGLNAIVDGWVISQSEGISKPNPEMFRRAAAKVGAEMQGAWMIGDNAESDIRAAQLIGCRTSWISRGREWPHTDFQPTRVDDDVSDALLATERRSRAIQ